MDDLPFERSGRKAACAFSCLGPVRSAAISAAGSPRAAPTSRSSSAASARPSLTRTASSSRASAGDIALKAEDLATGDQATTLRHRAAVVQIVRSRRRDRDDRALHGGAHGRRATAQRARPYRSSCRRAGPRARDGRRLLYRRGTRARRHGAPCRRHACARLRRADRRVERPRQRARGGVRPHQGQGDNLARHHSGDVGKARHAGGPRRGDDADPRADRRDHGGALGRGLHPRGPRGMRRGRGGRGPRREFLRRSPRRVRS